MPKRRAVDGSGGGSGKLSPLFVVDVDAVELTLLGAATRAAGAALLRS